jgi:hypothetical protein
LSGYDTVSASKFVALALSHRELLKVVTLVLTFAVCFSGAFSWRFRRQSGGNQHD